VVGGVRRRRDVWVAEQPAEDLLLARGLDVQMIDELDRASLARVEAAPEDGAGGQIVPFDPQLFADRGPQLVVGMVEGKPQLGETQHDLNNLKEAERKRPPLRAERRPE